MNTLLHCPIPGLLREFSRIAALVWLTCMLLAMQELGYTEDEQDLLLNAFFRTADWMRNRQG